MKCIFQATLDGVEFIIYMNANGNKEPHFYVFEQAFV